MTTAPKTLSVGIKPPRLNTMVFTIIGNAPLVIHRMSQKYNNMQRAKIEGGKATGSKRDRTAQDTDDIYNDARYVSKEGWDGFHAGAIRNAMIRACTLVDYKMTLAKMSIFVVQDGWDKLSPQIPLIRIYGKAVKQEDVVRLANGDPNLAFRPAYHDWSAKVKIRWDLDQFSLPDITNLLVRVGVQVGIGEGRPSSKNSTGMGWGTFDLKGEPK